MTSTRFCPPSSTSGRSSSLRTARPPSNGKAGRRVPDAEERQIKQLEAKLATKNEVIAELMEENVHLKKVDGEP